MLDKNIMQVDGGGGATATTIESTREDSTLSLFVWFDETELSCAEYRYAFI